MNIKKSSLNNLKPNKSPWKNSETCVIRVPKQLKNEILKYAKKIDNETNEDTSQISTVTLEKVSLIINKIQQKEKGYKSNSASRLIKDLLELIQ